MPTIPEDVRKAWTNRKGAVILATAAADGTPNAIYATCVRHGVTTPVFECPEFEKVGGPG